MSGVHRRWSWSQAFLDILMLILANTRISCDFLPNEILLAWETEATNCGISRS